MDNAKYEYELKEIIDNIIEIIESGTETENKKYLIRSMMRIETIISVLRWYERYNSTDPIIIED